MRNMDLIDLVPTVDVVDQGFAVSDSIVALGALDTLTRYVRVSIDTQPVRVTFDGSDPAAANGHLLAAGFSQTWSKVMADAAQFIRSGGDDGYLHATELTF